MIDKVQKLNFQRESIERILLEKSLLIEDCASEIDSINYELETLYKNLNDKLEKKDNTLFLKKISDLNKRKKIIMEKYKKELVTFKRAVTRLDKLSKSISEELNKTLKLK